MKFDRRSIMRFFRTKRMGQFREQFAITSTTRVLDVGGTLFNWSLLKTRPRLTLINITLPPERGDEAVDWVVADGRYLPFQEEVFDVVYCNSVIEHLGTPANQRMLAEECRRVGQSLYLQTPNRWFPIEPHLLAPIIHWLPRPMRKRLMRHFTLWGWMTKPSPQRCEERLDELRLLDERELQSLLPTTTLWRERVLGMTKSLIAVQLPAVPAPAAPKAELPEEMPLVRAVGVAA